LSGARLDWKSSMPISGAVCMGHPGSTRIGSTWQLEHRAAPSNSAIRGSRVEAPWRRRR
jgi:hypothetical protein